MNEIWERLDREIEKAKSLEDLMGNIANSVMSSYIKNMSLTDKTIVKLSSWIFRKSVLPMPWDYAVSSIVNYINEAKNDVIKIGEDNNGNYKTVKQVISTLTARFEDELYSASLKNEELEKYR